MPESQAESDEWPEPSDLKAGSVLVRVDGLNAYPFRYVCCPRCSRVVRDFQGDGVWRDSEGYLTCDNTSEGPWHNRSERVSPPPGGQP